MGQGQDSKHEEIHGQQEVDVLLGEYLRWKYKEKQKVRAAGGWQETGVRTSLLKAGHTPLELGHSIGENLTVWGTFQFLWPWGKKRGPPDAPPTEPVHLHLVAPLPGDRQH